MIQQLEIQSEKTLDIDAFLQELDVTLTLEAEGTDAEAAYYYLRRPDYSTSLFLIVDNRNGQFIVCMDQLATYDDYRFFPYLADCLNYHLSGQRLTVDGRSVYEYCSEDWAAQCIGDEIALLKSTLSVFPKYYQVLPAVDGTYFTKEQLAAYGVGMTSSTPRIHGYIQYMLRNGDIRTSTAEEMAAEMERYSRKEIVVDVPQHQSIGRVKSWQLDGSETWESYSREDVDMLLALGEDYKQGRKVAGVVLNDIGTLYQEGIGVDISGELAEYWFTEAIRQGDRLYAASNLGDLYRKGCGNLPVSLGKALVAYRQSADPYAFYRIGQAYEEGWDGNAPDLTKALTWYRMAADKGHHLALKRLNKRR